MKLKSVQKVDNKFYQKDNRPGCALLFLIAPVTNFVNKFQIQPQNGPFNRLNFLEAHFNKLVLYWPPLKSGLVYFHNFTLYFSF